MTEQEQQIFKWYKEGKEKEMSCNEAYATVKRINSYQVSVEEFRKSIADGTITLNKPKVEVTAEMNDIANDTGKHYRFQYTVAVSKQDAELGKKTINLDPFRIADIYGITNFAQNTALKKVLCAGNRGKKDLLEDINDIITALERWKQMLHEDESLVSNIQSPSFQVQNHENSDTLSNGGWICYD